MVLRQLLPALGSRRRGWQWHFQLPDLGLVTARRDQKEAAVFELEGLAVDRHGPCLAIRRAGGPFHLAAIQGDAFPLVMGLDTTGGCGIATPGPARLVFLEPDIGPDDEGELVPKG